MPTTTNYGWTTPADTDLVKDGASAIRTLGNSVDTTVKNLNPETTLGDISYRSSSANTKTRLGIGTTGQVLTVSGGVPVWSTPAGGGKILQVVETQTTTQESTTSESYVDTNLSLSITPSSASSKILAIASINAYTQSLGGGSNTAFYNILRGATEITYGILSTYNAIYQNINSANIILMKLDSPNTTSATTYKIQMKKSGYYGAWLSISGTPSNLILMEVAA